MIFVSQFHVYLPCLGTISNKCESTSRRFRLGEGPSRGLLRDYEPSCEPSFEALVIIASSDRG